MSNILKFLTLTTIFMIGFATIASAQVGSLEGGAPIDGGCISFAGRSCLSRLS
jgi:hypothetical protein